MANIGDINNLKDKDDNDLGMVPTHYFDAQGNKRNIAEDVAAIYQAINGKADSSQVGQSIGQLTQAVNSKADAAHTHTKSDITDFPTLGTAAAKNVPSSGNASSSQVVMGNDSRLSDNRNPTSHTHGTGDITGLDNTLNGLGSSIGTINGALEHKADESHTHDTLVDHNSASAVVALSWAGSAVSSVTPDGSNTRSSSKYLVAVYLDSGTPVFKDVDVGNVKVGDSLKINGRSVVFNSIGTDSNTLYIF